MILILTIIFLATADNTGLIKLWNIIDGTAITSVTLSSKIYYLKYIEYNGYLLCIYENSLKAKLEYLNANDLCKI